MKMLHTSQSALLEHRYSSGPLDWPLMDTNIAYWVNSHSNVSNLNLKNTSTFPIIIYQYFLCPVYE